MVAALMAVSLAVIRTLEAEKGLDLGKAADFVAGHSLGEYSALAAAGSLTISETAKLLRIRGDAMQAAVPVGQGAAVAFVAGGGAGGDFFALHPQVSGQRQSTRAMPSRSRLA